MKRISVFLAFVLLALVSLSSPCLAESLTLSKDTPIQVYFSPDGGCTDAINKVLGQARQDTVVAAILCG